VIDIPGVRDNVVDSARNLHYTQTMLEPSVRSTWVHQVCQSELMNIPQPLERTGTNDLFFVRSEPDENMDWIPYLTHSASKDVCQTTWICDQTRTHLASDLTPFLSAVTKCRNREFLGKTTRYVEISRKDKILTLASSPTRANIRRR
jgi:hypothetical protein